MVTRKRKLRKGLKMLLISVVIFIAVLALSISIFYFWAASTSIPEHELSQIINYPNPPPPPGKSTFKIMTYNIGYLSGMTNNRPIEADKDLFNKNRETFLHLLNKIKPDFLAAQEIDINSKRSFYNNQPQTIALHSDLKYTGVAINWDKRYVPFPYWPISAHFGKIVSGQTVLSRWPILSTERVVLLKPLDKPFFYNAFYLDRLVQVAKIKISEKTLVILNVHLEAFHNKTRERQARTVLDIYRSYKDEYPVILLGDFNCLPPGTTQKNHFTDEPDIDFSSDRTMNIFLKESSLKAAEMTTLTFPSNHPTRKLDYIFYNHEKILPLNTFTAEIDSSDHLPLVMEFSFL
jgi:endonuclease/exonuclease/phosphatase family metal-dependent hydrolase